MTYSPMHGRQRSPFTFGVLVLVTAAILLFATQVTAAGRTPQAVRPDQAHDLAKAGRIKIIDVRTAGEWQQTEMPMNAAGATIYPIYDNYAFLARVAKITGGDKSMPVALICARGIRSNRAARLLIRNDYDNVYDITGGMLGNETDAGWLKRGLPTSAP